MLFTRDQLIDSHGSMRTLSLFVEFRNPKYTPIMTLGLYPREFNGEELVSLKEIYMAEGDLEEYDVAMRVFGSWKHWKRLLENKKISAYIDEYRDELETKIRSEAVKSLIRTATVDGPKGTSAAKYVAERGWHKRKAGAPSKGEVKRELGIATKVDSAIKEDMERIGLKIVK